MCANEEKQEGSPWGLKRLTSVAAVGPNTPGYTYNPDASGQGVIIHILDDYIRGTHDEFLEEKGGTARRIRIPRGAVGPIYENISSHGTFVAGVAAGLTYGVAKSAYIGGLSGGRIERLPTQLRLILRNRTRKFDGTARPAGANPRPAVLNVSSYYPITDARVTLFYVELIKAGVHVVVAAGNNYSPIEANWCFDSQVDDGQHVVVPEADREHVHSVIWVGASTKDDKKLGISNYGPLIDLFAPGDDISSAANQSDAAVEQDEGTSFAAPHVAGIIACLLSDPQYRDLTPAQMKQKVLAMAWQNQVEGVTVPDLLKYPLVIDLLEVISDLQLGGDLKNWPENSAALRATFQGDFIEKASLHLKDDYIRDTLLPLLEFLKPELDQETAEHVDKVLDEDMGRVETALKGLVEEAILAQTITALQTTRRLASCRLDRWALGN